MATHVVKVPDVGEGVAEVELVAWFVTVGDEVKRNQMLAEVMTDKANVEIPSPVDGVIASLRGQPGETSAVGSLLLELTVPGPDGAAAGAGGATPSDVVAVEPVPVPVRAPVSAATSAVTPATPRPPIGRRAAAEHNRGSGLGPDPGPPRAEGERPRATPSVRRRARDGGIDLRRVPGTGPAARITHGDLDAYFASDPDPGPRAGRAADESVSEEPIIGLRRRIARAMVASASTIPHITYVEEVDVTALEDLRAVLNDGRRDDQPRLTILPFLIRALVNHLPEFPHLNAHVDDERELLTTYGGVHVGIATQTEGGLVVPVVHHAEADSLWTLARRITELAEAARTKAAKPGDLTGSTITITSLGALGGLVTTPVINKPEVAIIGVNKIAIRPVWIDGAFVPRKIMNLSSSFDHRVVDGWDAAQFIQRIKTSLEQPALLFFDES